MRIIQLIDSLEAGGAERMAVNFANALATTNSFSGLVATRNEGPFRSKLDGRVNYLYLARKRRFDLAAVFRLQNFVKLHQVQIVHAHSTSILLAVMLKVLYPRIKIIWHDHYGNSEYLAKRPSYALKVILRFCDGAIAVNSMLEHWIKHELNFQNTLYLPNFAEIDLSKSETILHGRKNFRIICLANLRRQKNHILLIKVAARLKLTHPQWTFHLVGKDFSDDYSELIHKMVVEMDLSSTVFIYGSRPDTAAIISQCDIAVLSSDSEGLPVALLEYGLLSKPVLATAVGEIPFIIEDGKNGYLAASGNLQEYYEKMRTLIDDSNRSRLGVELHKTVIAQFSAEFVIDTYLKWVKKL